jgi:hypothetical protein
MEFLSQYAKENHNILKLYEILTKKKYDFLWESEKDWLGKNTEKFEGI